MRKPTRKSKQRHLLAAILLIHFTALHVLLIEKFAMQQDSAWLLISIAGALINSGLVVRYFGLLFPKTRTAQGKLFAIGAELESRDVILVYIDNNKIAFQAMFESNRFEKELVLPIKEIFLAAKYAAEADAVMRATRDQQEN